EQNRRRVLVPARWGFSSSRARLIVNARSETAPEKFSSAFAERRCVMPVDGFYEWTGYKKQRHPVWYHARNKGLLLLAALYETRADGTTGFTVLTTTPNRLTAQVHDRMPAIIAPTSVATWLSAPSPQLLQPAPEEVLVAEEVSSRANSVSHDD